MTAMTFTSDDPLSSSDDESVSDEKEPLLKQSESLSSSDESEPHSTDTPRPNSSPCKRLVLLVLLVLSLWTAFSLFSPKKKPQIIYASRYSKEYKFRPAASPIITETLKDGRIRLRGAQQDPTPQPDPTVKPKKKKPKAGKLSKRKAKKTVARRK